MYIQFSRSLLFTTIHIIKLFYFQAARENQPSTSVESDHHYSSTVSDTDPHYIPDGNDCPSDADSSPSMPPPAKVKPKSHKKRVHDVFDEDYGESQKTVWDKFQGKSGTKGKGKGDANSDADTALQGMAESVSNLAEMLQAGGSSAQAQPAQPDKPLSVIELWSQLTGKKIEFLSSRRARRVMYTVDGIVIEAMEDEGVEMDRPQKQGENVGENAQEEQEDDGM